MHRSLSEKGGARFSAVAYFVREQGLAWPEAGSPRSHFPTSGVLASMATEVVALESISVSLDR